MPIWLDGNVGGPYKGTGSMWCVLCAARFNEVSHHMDGEREDSLSVWNKTLTWWGGGIYGYILREKLKLQIGYSEFRKRDPWGWEKHLILLDHVTATLTPLCSMSELTQFITFIHLYVSVCMVLLYNLACFLWFIQLYCGISVLDAFNGVF